MTTSLRNPKNPPIYHTAGLASYIMTLTNTTNGGEYLSCVNYLGNDTIKLLQGTGGVGILQIADQTGTSLIVFSGSGSAAIGSASTTVSAVLSLISTSKGFLPPVMTTAQKGAIASPATGIMVFDSDLAKLCVYTGAAWETITSV